MKSVASGNIYYEKVSQGKDYNQMDPLGYFSNFSKIQFIPTLQNAKGAPLEINLNGVFLFSNYNCDGNSAAYIKSGVSSNQNGNNYLFHASWTSQLIKISSSIPSQYFTKQEFGLGGCGYLGTSNYLNMPDGTIGSIGAIGFR